MARKKRLEDMVPSAVDFIDALDSILHPDVNAPDYSECVTSYPDFDPIEDHRGIESWVKIELLPKDKQLLVKKQVLGYASQTGKEFMVVKPRYCEEKNCCGHFDKSLAYMNTFPRDLNNCYLYISKESGRK